MRDRTAVHTTAVLPQDLSADRLDLTKATTETSASCDKQDALVIVLSARYQKTCALLGVYHLGIIIAHCLIIGKVKRTKPWCKPTRYCEERVVALTRASESREWDLTPSPWFRSIAVCLLATIIKFQHKFSSRISELCKFKGIFPTLISTSTATLSSRFRSPPLCE